MGLFFVKPTNVEKIHDVVDVKRAEIDDNTPEDLLIFPSLIDFQLQRYVRLKNSWIFPKGYKSQAGVDMGHNLVGVASVDKRDNPVIDYEVVLPRDVLQEYPEQPRPVTVEDIARQGIASALFHKFHQGGHSPAEQAHIENALNLMRDSTMISEATHAS